MTYAAPLFVTAEFTNNTTGEIKSQTVFMGDFPVMTRKGTFIINGTERVVVSQLVRSPGVYFDHRYRQDHRQGRLLASRSSPAAARGWSSTSTSATPSASASTASAASRSPCCSRRSAGTTEQIRQRFGFSETMLATLEKDHTAGQDEALLDIYRKLRPGEPPTKESAQALLENLFFKDKRYDLAKVGRYKANKKLGPRRSRPRSAR